MHTIANRKLKYFQKVIPDVKSSLINFSVTKKEEDHFWTSSFLVAGTRIELVTSGLWIRRSNQLSYPAILF